MITAKLVLPLLLLCRTVYTDMKESKIENWVILIGFVSALVLAYWQWNMQGILICSRAAGVTLLILFPLFLLKGLGAGDIKLLSLLAAFFPEKGFEIIWMSFIVAGVFVILRIIYRSVKKEKIFIKNETLHFSIPIAFAVGIEVWMGL